MKRVVSPDVDVCGGESSELGLTWFTAAIDDMRTHIPDNGTRRTDESTAIGRGAGRFNIPI